MQVTIICWKISDLHADDQCLYSEVATFVLQTFIHILESMLSERVQGRFQRSTGDEGWYEMLHAKFCLQMTYMQSDLKSKYKHFKYERFKCCNSWFHTKYYLK